MVRGMEATGTIVCGVDHSPGGRAAAKIAVQLSERLRFKTVFVHAVQPPIPAYEMGTPAAPTNFVAVDQMREAGTALLEELAGELGSGSEIAREVRIGSAADAIAAAAEKDDAEFVVVGSRGLGSVGALFLGSVSLRLAGHGPCPTLIVPPSAETFGDGSILCAVDDSDHSRAALATAAALAERLDARLVVAHADDDDAASSRGLELLTRLVVESDLGAKVETILVRGEPADAIVEAAGAHDAALIAIGSRGRGALASSVLGSVSSAVANQSTSPVLVVRADAKPAGSV
jgi:nucleotide-binding universal stress UspA family protein